MKIYNKGADFVLKATALDAAGQPVTGFSPTAADWTITDGNDGEYTINSVTWAGAVGSFAVTSPSTPGVQTLEIAYKGNAINTNPPTIQLALVENYRGKFNLENAIVAWDCALGELGNERDKVYDYSSNFRTGTTFTGQDFNYLEFTATSQYKAGPSGSLITLGRTCVGTKIQSVAYGAELLLSDLAAVAVATALDTPPIRTIQGIFWRNEALKNSVGAYNFPADYFHTLLKYSAYKATEGNRTWWVILNRSTIQLIDSARNVLLSYDIEAPNNTWLQQYEIVAISLRMNGDGTTDFFVNQTLVGSVAMPDTGIPDNDKFFSCMGNRTDGDQYYVLPFATACLDYACFSTVKTDAEIRTNAAAWGL